MSEEIKDDYSYYSYDEVIQNLNEELSYLNEELSCRINQIESKIDEIFNILRQLKCDKN